MKKYLVNGFPFITEAFEKYKSNEYRYEYIGPRDSSFYYLRNIWAIRKLILSRKIEDYDVIHFNNWENFLQYKKIPGQVIIAESHAFHLGLHKTLALADATPGRRLFAQMMGASLLHKKIRERIKKFDIYYVAIPNLLDEAKKIREDAKWLPNPIDTTIFKPAKQMLKMEGDPAIFFPTRLHQMKEPEKGFAIFMHIAKEYPSAKLHLIRYPEQYSQYQLYEPYLQKLSKYIVWHPFINRADLPQFYRSFDLILGAFGKGLLNLVELEAMACNSTVLTFDKYELVKKSMPELPGFALDLLSKPAMKRQYTKKCYEYVHAAHSIETVYKKHKKYLEKF